MFLKMQIYTNFQIKTKLAIVGRRGDEYAHQVYKPDHIQDLQSWLDRTHEAMMVLEANRNVVAALQRFYRSLLEKKDFPLALKNEQYEDVVAFVSHLDEVKYDFESHSSRAKLLSGIIRDRKELVGLIPAIVRMDRTNNQGTDSTAPSSTGVKEDRTTQRQHGKRCESHANHYHCYSYLPSCDVHFRQLD